MPEFIKGLALCEMFFNEVAEPLLKELYPDIRYSAGRLGGGSDVLGYDTSLSRGHDWGPQVDIFLSEDDYAKYAREIYVTLSYRLPLQFKGYSTHFEYDYLMGKAEKHPIIHRVRIHTVASFFSNYIGFDPSEGIDEIAWLRVPSQQLRTIQSGRVFRDDIGALGSIRNTLRWYPDEIWYYLLACQWGRIDQDEPFMARCGHVGDELGSRLVAARQVQEIMRLCFLMERQYAPYTKWFGTGFSALSCAAQLEPMLRTIFETTDWQSREQALNAVYIALAEKHNDLGITEEIKPELSPFHDRPYLVPNSKRFADALMEYIQSETLVFRQEPIGSIFQFVDSTDISCWPEAWEKLSGIYELTSEAQ